jgi:hypothetical protein
VGPTVTARATAGDKKSSVFARLGGDSRVSSSSESLSSISPTRASSEEMPGKAKVIMEIKNIQFEAYYPILGCVVDGLLKCIENREN